MYFLLLNILREAIGKKICNHDPDFKECDIIFSLLAAIVPKDYGNDGGFIIMKMRTKTFIDSP